MSTVLHASTDFDQVMAKHPLGFEVILVRQDGAIHGYRNRCPHVGVGLDWGDGRCLDGPGELRCALHGARFLATTGECVAGPCFGDHLERVPVRVVGDTVVCD